MNDIRLKVLRKVRLIPQGSTVSKVGEITKYILGDELVGWSYGNQKRDPIKASEGYRFLIENVDLGIGTSVPDNLELVWYATGNDLIEEAKEMW